MAHADAPFDAFERKWLEAHPEQIVVALFVAPAQRRTASAFGSLVHELELCCFAIREPEVAAAKLEWWRQELLGASAGTARHPITQTLFAAPQVRAIAPSRWSELTAGAMAQLEAPPAPSFAALCGALASFYRPVAALEAALLGVVYNEANSQLWIGSHLRRAAAGMEFAPERSVAVPLDLLARHGVTRADLGRGGAAARAALREHTARVGELLAQALRADAGPGLGVRVRARLDLERAERAARAADPAAALRRRHPWRTLWLAWREARRTAGGW